MYIRQFFYFFKNRYVYLFISLIVFILLIPVCQLTSSGKWLINIGLYFISLITVASLQQNRGKLILGLVLGLAILLLSSLDLTSPNLITRSLHVFFSFLFFSFVSVSIFINILEQRVVSQNLIFAALCAYLFIGFSFGQLYHLIEIIQPGAFLFSKNVDLSQTINSFYYLYFSFTVLTSVGFGDVIPASNYAKSLVMIEEITGIFYVAIFVARLISTEKIIK